MRFIFCLLVSLSISALNFANATDKFPSPAAYIGNPEYRFISLSPDGKYIVAARNLPAEHAPLISELNTGDKKTVSFAKAVRGDQIVIMTVNEKKIIASFGLPAHAVYGLYWANTDRILAFVSASYDVRLGRGYKVRLPAVRTLSIDWQTRQTTVLFETNKRALRDNLFLSRIVDPLISDDTHILMSAYKGGDIDLWRVNITTGDAKRIDHGNKNTRLWLTNSEGKPVFRLDQNDNASTVRIFTKNSSGKWKKILTTRLNEKGEAPEFWPIAFGEKPNEMLVLTAAKDEPRKTLKIYDLETGMFKENAAEHPVFDIAGGLTDNNTGRYLGAFYYDDHYKMILKDKTLQKHVDAISKFFEDGTNIYLHSISRNQKQLILEVRSPNIPGDLYTYNIDKTNIKPLFSLRPNLSVKHITNVETIRYTARDGELITGYVTHPKNKWSEYIAPLIIMPHGGPEQRDYRDFDPYAQFLANRGYRVFQPNFRGSAGYGNNFARQGYREWGGKMHDDLMDGIKYLQKKSLASPGHACIIGGSYGGYAALYAAMANPEEFKCAASIAGVTDLIDLINNAKKDSKEAYNIRAERIGHPRHDGDNLVAKSPARNIDKFTTPLLFVHGRYDQIVPYKQSIKMMDALDEAKVDYERLTLNDGHAFEKLGSHVQTLRKLESFLKKHLDR